MPLEAARVVAELPPHPLHLLQDDACMMQQRLPRRCRPGPAASPLQQRNAERLLHAANAGARRGEGHVRPVGAMRDAAGRSEEHTSELQSLMRTSYAVFCLKK